MQKNALSVTPSLLQLDLATDKPEAQLTYTNTTNQTLIVSLSASDFAPLEDGYKLSFLSQKDAKNYQYSLSSWIDFSEKTLIIPPQSAKEVTVFIAKDKLTPGGHYATILASVTGDENSSVQINTVMASLLFVRTNTGLEKDEGNIAGISVDQDILNYPTVVSFRLNNTGDTALTPYGTLRITDPFNREISRGIVNIDSLQALPESIRQFDIPLQPTALAFLPGAYTVHLTIHFSKSKIYNVKTFSFFSQSQIPYAQILLVVCLLSLAVLLIRKNLPRNRR